MVRCADLTIQGWNKTESAVVNLPFTQEFVVRWLGELSPETRARRPEDAVSKIVYDIRTIAAGQFSSSREFNPQSSDQVTYQLNTIGGWMLFLTCYTIAAGLGFVLLAFAFRRADKRLAERWHSEITRLGLTPPTPTD